MLDKAGIPDALQLPFEILSYPMSDIYEADEWLRLLMFGPFADLENQLDEMDPKYFEDLSSLGYAHLPEVKILKSLLANFKAAVRTRKRPVIFMKTYVTKRAKQVLTKKEREFGDELFNSGFNVAPQRRKDKPEGRRSSKSDADNI